MKVKEFLKNYEETLFIDIKILDITNFATNTKKTYSYTEDAINDYGEYEVCRFSVQNTWDSSWLEIIVDNSQEE